MDDLLFTIADESVKAKAYEKLLELGIELPEAVSKHLAGKHDQSTHGGGRGTDQPAIRLSGTFSKPEYGYFNDELGDKLTEASGASYPVPTDPKISGGLVAAEAPYVGLSAKAQAIAAKIGPSSPARIERDEKYETETRIQTAEYAAGDKTYELEIQKLYGFRDGVTDSSPSRVFVYARAKSGSNREVDGKIIIEKTINFSQPSSPYGYIERVNASDKGVGLATAMLEMARRETEFPIFHSTELSAEGAEFARTTKSFTKAEETYTPTQGMKTAAKRALRWKKEGKATGAGTPIGWGRATDIVAGRNMSLSTVKRMYSFFSRHEVDKKGKDFDNISNPSNGRIMWDAWGGDAGFTWSRAIVERAKNVEKHLAGKHNQDTHAGGKGRAYTSIQDVIADAKNLAEERIAVRGGKNISDVGDDLHVAIAQKLGLDGKPEIVDSIDDLDGEPMYRGLAPNASGKPAQTMAEEYAFADIPRVGVGTFGSGTYFAETKEFTKQYSNNGVTLVAGWKKGAKIYEFPSEEAVFEKARSFFDEALLKSIRNNPSGQGEDVVAFSKMRTMKNDWIPIQLMADGYDGYTLPYRQSGETTKITVVLNREALQVVNPTS